MDFFHAFKAKEVPSVKLSPGRVQGQVGWGLEQPGLVKGVPFHGMGLEFHDPRGPFQPNPCQNSVINSPNWTDAAGWGDSPLSHKTHSPNL